MGQTNEIRLDLALDAVQSSTLKTRTEGLRDLKTIFDRTHKASNIGNLTDKAYHRIYEVLFKASLTEQQAYASTKKNTKAATLARLTSCADVLRMAAKAGAQKLKVRTVEAVVEHITQTLSNANDECCERLSQHYLKALSSLFEHPTNVEHLKTDTWVTVVDFCLERIDDHLDDNEGEPAGLSRSFSGLGSNAAPSSSGKLGLGNNGVPAVSLSRQNLEDLLQTLFSLVSSSNAPLVTRYEAISESAMRFLKSHNSSVSQLHQLALSVVNAILLFTREDYTSFSQSVASDIIPLLSRIWQGKTLAKDEMLNSVRDEMLILLIYIHPHLERTIRDGRIPDLATKVEELLFSLRADYARRTDRDQLQLDDLEMTDFGDTFTPSTPFRIPPFRLRPHNVRAERNWATLQILGILERLVSIEEGDGKFDATLNKIVKDNHPRKRQRTSKDTDRLISPIISGDEKLLTTGLQALPFVLEHYQLSTSALSELLRHLQSCTSDKRGSIASWALLAIASCTRQDAGLGIAPEEWLQLWHIGARALTFSPTCRAAAVQLHAMLDKNLVHYSNIRDDISAMITAADISGPQLLCDSAVFLMVHLLHLSVTEIPSASLAACQHVIRWIFARWVPLDKSFEAHHALHLHPHHITTLLRTCLGLSRIKLPSSSSLSSGTIAQAWEQHLLSNEVLRYLLLLGDSVSQPATTECQDCPKIAETNDITFISNTAHFLSARKLILELIAPKCSALLQSWNFTGSDRPSTIATDHYRSGIKACITMLIIATLFDGVNLLQLQSFYTELQELSIGLVGCVHEVAQRDFQGVQTLTETLLQSLQPYLPSSDTRSLGQMRQTYPQLLEFITVVAEAFKANRLIYGAPVLAVDTDPMDLDDDFDTQQSIGRAEGQKANMPRKDLALELWPNTFYVATIARLMLVNTLNNAAGQSGMVPSEFVDLLLLMKDEEILSCRKLLREILSSDLTLDIGDAARIVEHLGSMLSANQFDMCEVALGLCLDVLIGLEPYWAMADGSDLAGLASQLYRWFVETALYKEVASSSAQNGISKLLLTLLRGNQPEYGVNLGLPSPRSSLFYILEKSSTSVKFAVANQLPQIFGLFVSKDHDDVFVDILNKLPSDPNRVEGLAFRLYVFAKLGSRWPTLLRRCMYHIVETASKTPVSAKHATHCMTNLSKALKVESPKELFALFSSQILFTWLETEPIEGLTPQIYGFRDLKDLVVHVQDEAAALMIMRAQDAALERVTAILEVTIEQLLQNCFPRIMAYSIAYDLNASRADREERGSSCEGQVKRLLGQDRFFDCLNVHFADIIALRFSIIDLEENAMKHFSKHQEIVYAANIIQEIKTFSSSDATLPPNQQPAFGVKHLFQEIHRLCSRTQFDPANLYTPALVVLIARKLFNTIHPALGSLHACSVLRKIRILVAVSGSSSVSGYPVEMLLQSVRPFVTDSECADDAIGITQYLLTRGSAQLLHAPTFLAGIGLSILGAMRTFLRSSRASSTQESQFKSTMSKAQAFHKWIGDYLLKYSSDRLGIQSQAKFRALVQSAYSIRSVGNADTGTAESELLYRLLEDEKSNENLLSRPARDYALSMLCSEFRSPASYRSDIFGADNLAIENAAVVWKSSRSESASMQYLNWAARVLGRAFVASGHIHEELLQESTLGHVADLFPRSDGDMNDSRECLLSLLQALTLGHDRVMVGLAEAALRVIVTTSDEPFLEVCQKVLPPHLYAASTWQPYPTAPSDLLDHEVEIKAITEPYSASAILRTHWLRDLSVVLTQTVPNDPLLRALIPILLKVPGFATRAFPYILHLILSIQSEIQDFVKRQLSTAFLAWLTSTEAIDKNTIKMLINSVLYLRTQPMVQEKSLADRSRWLEVDYVKVAMSASHCGMYKTALLLVEESFSGQATASRRSSVRDGQGQSDSDVPTELLLTIFQNIDDPDLYYGVQQNSNLSNILARFEHERDGPKSLAFRGALYDSHVRRGATESGQDVESLVKALDVLSLSGLSHSLLQAQQSTGMSSASLDSMFRTARKLEQWDIPVPSPHSNNSVTIYKAFQSITKASDDISIRLAINEGLEKTMKDLVKQDLGASALHASLQTLAALVELDELLSTRGSEAFEDMLARFRSRSAWMKTGRFDDITQILSCRGTTLSTLSQSSRLQEIVKVSQLDTRLVEVQTALLSCNLNRAHSALQESLSLATSLMELIKPCQDLGLNIEAAIQVEAANVLWEQGEVTSSIGMLQAIESGQTLKKQNIHVGRSDLLSKIGHQVSLARLEKADRIIDKYLKPALKDLRGKSYGNEAGQVFHQFAVFCDQQLQDPDSLEDLERLRKLSKMKKDEVEQLERMLATATGNEKARYKGHLGKARSWLKLDEEELQRHNANRDEFLRQSLENYLLALSASDEHDNNALRFSALWLEHSESQLANEAAANYLSKVPSRKLAPLMNQLTSRLQESNVLFQQLLFKLVLRICKDHPFHGMYQIYAAANSRPNPKDESAISRHKATNRVAKQLSHNEKVQPIWSSISATNKAYCGLAGEKDDSRYKSGRKIALKETQAGTRLNLTLSKYQIPPPTMQIPLAADLDYSKVPVMVRFDSHMSIASGVSAPKIVTAVANNGARYKQLVKGGNDDLRQDAIMEQVFDQVSELLKANRTTRQRNLSIRTYKVLPLTSSAGVIEFVANTLPLHDYLMPAHERYHPKDLKGNQCRKEIGDVQSSAIDIRIKKFRSVMDRFHPVMRYFFIERFTDPDEWFAKRNAYTRSTAAISILGHVLGLGDRHGHNILLDSQSGEVVHIDLGVAFEMGRVLPVPELVPFRLTRDIVDGMGITKTEGVFRRCCEFTLEALRKEIYSIMTILDVLRYDPLYSWSISPVRLAKLQEGQSAAPEPTPNGLLGNGNGKQREVATVNEPGEADRALTVVNKKLSKTLSVTATVNDLINQASDERNLAVLYSGWAAYA